MTRTPLYDKLAGMGAPMGEYCGVETPRSYGDSRAEFSSLLRGCAVQDLGWRALFRVSGRDRVRWLNNMVSNNVRDLPAGCGNYSFLLSAQGHIQGDLYVYNHEGDFVAATDAAQFEKILLWLRKYIIMDQVELTDLRGELTAIGVQGPEALKVLQQAGISRRIPEPLELAELEWRGWKGFVTRKRFETYEIWAPQPEAPAAWDALVAAGATPVGVDALEMFRLAAGIPRFGLDIRERDLPQETGQMQALNFTKGCYIGQEIVERIRSRGSVHRIFTGFALEGAIPPAGTKIQANGKELGEITSALAVPTNHGDRGLALGYVRREAAKPGFTLQAGETAAIVTELPFPEILSLESLNHAKQKG
jgi:folate-binding protein YgfZ